MYCKWCQSGMLDSLIHICSPILAFRGRCSVNDASAASTRMTMSSESLQPGEVNGVVLVCEVYRRGTEKYIV